jgi:hypothetical protein
MFRSCHACLDRVWDARTGLRGIMSRSSEFRIGFGYDIHRLAAGRRLVLGGVPVEHPLGLQGHSDGDVVLHAVTDALLGAAGLPDIGELFPDTAAEWKDADSRRLLNEVMRRDSRGVAETLGPQAGDPGIDRVASGTASGSRQYQGQDQRRVGGRGSGRGDGVFGGRAGAARPNLTGKRDGDLAPRGIRAAGRQRAGGNQEWGSSFTIR